jgi:alkanesulfonate monooxygenase SsuD/methylene tetrahydromethanopterin reductase-like flavin-dependent oxidoreductase (luciferase family)
LPKKDLQEEKVDLILGKVGIWTFDFDRQPMAQVREEVAELEALGYGAIWIPEVAGREALTHAAVLLAATNRMVGLTVLRALQSARRARWLLHSRP